MARHYSSMKKGEMYASREQANVLRMADNGMIHEDRSAACLLPTNVIEKYYAAGNYSAPTGIADLYTGAQKRLGEDQSAIKREAQLGNYW